METWELTAELAEREYDLQQNIEYYKSHHILDDNYEENVSDMKNRLAYMVSVHNEIKNRAWSGEKFDWTDIPDI